MKGQRNGLIAKLRNENPDIVDVGCVCHLANLAVGAALKALPINVDELLSDIYNHFNTRLEFHISSYLKLNLKLETNKLVHGFKYCSSFDLTVPISYDESFIFIRDLPNLSNQFLFYSTKRMEQLKEFQEFVGAEAEKILKHCPTRWLSLRRCIVRLISQYSALKSYFSSHPDAEKPRSKVGLIHSTLQDPTTMAWLRFLEFTLDPFYRFNAKFQVNTSCITITPSQYINLFLSW